MQIKPVCRDPVFRHETVRIICKGNQGIRMFLQFTDDTLRIFREINVILVCDCCVRRFDCGERKVPVGGNAFSRIRIDAVFRTVFVRKLLKKRGGSGGRQDDAAAHSLVAERFQTLPEIRALLVCAYGEGMDCGKICFISVHDLFS